VPLRFLLWPVLPTPSLRAGAMKEIVSLRQFGWTGKLARALVSEGNRLRLIRQLERVHLPLDFASFNRCHHGGTVQAQDIEVLRSCLRSGEQQGRPMSSLREVLQKHDAYDGQQQAWAEK
jgi:hypothetical protein